MSKANSSNGYMPEENKPNALGMIFATMVNARLWKILEEALRNGGTCEFEDPDKDIGEFFLTKFEGLKVKDGRSTIFFTAPSRLTVWPQWVEMYKSHGDDWRALHEQFAFYHLLALPVPPTDAFDSIRKHDYLPKLGEKPKRELIDALEHWQQVIHIALLNGNTPQNLRS